MQGLFSIAANNFSVNLAVSFGNYSMREGSVHFACVPGTNSCSTYEVM